MKKRGRERVRARSGEREYCRPTVPLVKVPVLSHSNSHLAGVGNLCLGIWIFSLYHFATRHTPHPIREERNGHRVLGKCRQCAKHRTKHSSRNWEAKSGIFFRKKWTNLWRHPTVLSGMNAPHLQGEPA